MDRQLELYQQVILEHNRKPRNFGKLDPASHAGEGFNPICGDHFWVYLQIGENQIERMGFEGSGCAISKASASMMTEAVKGKSTEQALQICSQFQSLIKGQMEDPSSLGKLGVFSGVWKYPARVKCAGLAWHALQGALQGERCVSTE